LRAAWTERPTAGMKVAEKADSTAVWTAVLRAERLVDDSVGSRAENLVDRRAALWAGPLDLWAAKWAGTRAALTAAMTVFQSAGWTAGWTVASSAASTGPQKVAWTVDLLGCATVVRMADQTAAWKAGRWALTRADRSAAC